MTTNNLYRHESNIFYTNLYIFFAQQIMIYEETSFLY